MIEYLSNHSFQFTLDILIPLWFLFGWLTVGLALTTFLWIDANLYQWGTFKEILTPYSAPRVLLLTVVCILLPPLAMYVVWNEQSVRNFRKKICNKLTKKFGGK